MGVKVTYKGETLTDFSSSTKILKTSGKYLEGDISIEDEGSSIALVKEYMQPSGGISVDITSAGAALLSVVDTLDSAGGTIRNITADLVVNLQTKTVVPSSSAITVSPDSGYDGLSECIVTPPSAPYLIPTGTATVTENGTVDISEYEYVSVTVVPSGLTLQAKSATPSTAVQTVTADTGYDGLSSVEVGAIPSEFIVPTGTLNITQNGTTDVTSYASVSVNVGTVSNQDKTVTPSESQQSVTFDSGYTGLGTVTVNAVSSSYVGSDVARNTLGDIGYNWEDKVSIPSGYYAADVTYTIPESQYKPNPYIEFEPGTGLIKASVTYDEDHCGYFSTGTQSAQLQLPTVATSTITPTESRQLAVSMGNYVTGPVYVGAIDSSYVGSNIARKSASDLTASGSVVTVPAGYYSAQASKAVAAGAAAVPTTAITANPTLSVNASGLVTASVAATSTVAPTITAGYVSTGASGAMNVSGSSTLQLTTQAAATITPSESQQTAVASQRYTTGNVVVAAISANYVGSGITRRSSTDLTASGSAVTAPAGYYSAAATKTVSAGTAGTPTAAKGTVSNHQISITPSVTNTTGWITGSTKTGTAVTVSASELVSGTSTISANGTYDVTNYASAAVSIDYVTYYTGRDVPTSSLGSDGDIYLQV